MSREGDVKNYICEQLSGEKFDPFANPIDHPYGIANHALRQWAMSANGPLQDAAIYCFKLPDKHSRGYKRNEKYIKLLRLIYTQTQKDLKARGLRYLILYRGQNDKIKYLRPLSSFSTNKGIAEGFGPYLYQISVPIKYIVSSFFTGIGCMNEQEYVIMGANNVHKHLKPLFNGYLS